MKQILFVYPHNHIYSTKDLAEEIADVLLGFSTSNNVKYTFGPKYIVIHFKTEIGILPELEEVLDLLSKQNGVDFTYFLIPIVYGFRTNISKDIENYLNDFDYQPSYYDDDIMTDYNFITHLENFVSEIKNTESELSIDEILDKINDKGIDSLTRQELNKLNNQSKKY
jgi:hypothetical protein